MTRTPKALLIVTLTLGALALAQLSPPPSAAQDKKPKGEFVGSKKCKKCHLPEYKSWAKTPHAKAFLALAPGEKAKEKKAAGLDPATDYRKDPKCVKCHVVGLGEKGGFELTSNFDKDKPVLQGVGCEMCHGPGKEFVGKGMKDNDYKDEANHKARLPGLIAAGYVPEPNKESCTQCHNSDSPTFTGEFDFEERKKKGVHDVEKKK